MHSIAWWPILTLLAIATVVDIHSRRIPNWLVLPFLAAGVAVNAAGTVAWVSNWGGRRSDANSVTGPAGNGTLVRVDPVRFVASEGSVSVIDLGQADDKSAARIAKSEILTGAGACAIATSPDRLAMIPR